MCIMKEYKKQSIYILLGLLVILFPFFKNSYFPLAILFLGWGIFFSVLSPNSYIFRFFARESDTKSGKLAGLMQLFLTTAILLMINLIVGENKFPAFIIGGAFAITTFGDGISDIINMHEKEKKHNDNNHNNLKFYSAKSSIVFLISGSIFASVAGLWIFGARGFSDPELYLIIFLSVIGALTGALLESMTRNEDNIIIPFGSAMVMWLFYMFGYSVDPLYLMKVLVFSFVLGYLSYKARIADISAMLSATLFGVVIIISSDIKWFFILLAFFMLGSLFTRYKYELKFTKGIAEGKGGARGYKNVFSNSLPALVLAVMYGVFPSRAIMAGFLGSIATACGDTLASEIGETNKGEPRMITTLKKAKPGTDGAVSGLGELAALLGASAIAVLAFLIIPTDRSMVFGVIAGGFLGTNIDSLLGATLQRRGYLTNNGVNLLATVSGAIISGFLYYGL